MPARSSPWGKSAKQKRSHPRLAARVAYRRGRQDKPPRWGDIGGGG